MSDLHNCTTDLALLCNTLCMLLFIVLLFKLMQYILLKGSSLLYILFLGVLEMSDLSTLVDEISIVSTKWDKLGQGLGLPSKCLTDIRTSFSTSHDCLKEMLKRWLQESLYTPWTHICDALSGIGESQLADQLKTKYIPGKLTTAHDSDGSH